LITHELERRRQTPVIARRSGADIAAYRETARLDAKNANSEAMIRFRNGAAELLGVD
jgi:hypothetical protein